MTDHPQPESAPYPVTETNIWAVISLISGILSWLGVFGLGGIAAVVCGHVAKSQIAHSQGQMTGDGLATAGLILGYLNIALAVFGLCLAMLIIAGVLSGTIFFPFIFGNFH
jgi:hypothetical protein